jgi:6-phosphofructokinase 1
MSRESDLNLGTNETEILEGYIQGTQQLSTKVPEVELDQVCIIKNWVHQNQIGQFRQYKYRKAITVDYELMDRMKNKNIVLPFLMEAGPREDLTFNPRAVKAAILTTGGIAPGFNSVIHAIVQRHCKIYSLNKEEGGKLYGILNGFKGLLGNTPDYIELESGMTFDWLGLGGTQLGSIRDYGYGKDRNKTLPRMAKKIVSGLQKLPINILYIIGGDGSMRMAHEIWKCRKDLAVVGVPKTMDNDLLWVWESFGFNTAVEEATRVINTLHREAESTRRICIIELFGAESGFVAANATMASGHVDLVLIPEVLRKFSKNSDKMVSEACGYYLKACIDHIKDKVNSEKVNPHAVIVIAEGVSDILNNKIKIPGYKGKRIGKFCEQFRKYLGEVCINQAGKKIEVFINQPKHNIRAVPANARDQIYCEQLGAMAVDSALAGYTDILVSQWMTEFVLVPLEMVTIGQKSINLDSVFWKQVTNITRQPRHNQFL